MSEAMRIHLLGCFSVSVGLRTIEERQWRLRKAASLVKLLALAPEHRVHRERVMDLLWPDLTPGAAANNLYQALHAARQVLEPKAATPSYLHLHDEQLTLCPDSTLWVDVEAFQNAALTARRSPEPAAYRTAVELYAGDLLPGDLYEPWADERREGLRLTYLTLLVEIAVLYEECGVLEPAIETLQEVVSSEPTHEEAHAALMRLYARLGQRFRALRQYQQLRTSLRRELDTEPDATSLHLYEEISAGRIPTGGRSTTGSRLPAEPAIVTKHNIPGSLTSFIGRERELVEVKRALAMTGLLTLTGAGGCGKTRLALEVAKDLVGLYPDGVWLVELAPLSDPTLVPQAVAGALGVREQPNQPLTDTLVAALKTRKLLLVLDNCEHLIDAVAHLAETLLISCPGLRVLATSRETLGVAGEVSRVVPSLSLPDSRHPPTVEELAEYESARLFVERALRRPSAFVLTPKNVGAVANICRRLEGLPLTIELAAVRVGTLAVEQISERLGDSLKLLTTGSRTATPRQQTLRGALDWSHELLSEPEKKLFARLSVFAGGWTLEAVEVVGSGDGIERDHILDLLSRLVEKSLVVARVSPEAESTPRYRMLEPVRQYARARLEESDETGAVRHRHAAFFLSLAERAEPELKGRGQVEWLERLEEDNDNLRAAMAWLLEKDEVEAAVRLAWALWHFWLIHGYHDEGGRWIEAALTKAGSLSAHARAKALLVQAAMSYGLGSPERQRRPCEEAAALFRGVGDKLGLAYAVSGVGTAMMQQGDAERAIASLKESIELTRGAGDKLDQWFMSAMLAHLGSIYLSQGDYEQATRYFEEGLALAREIGNRLSVSISLYNLALATQGQGDHERAAELYAEGLRSSAEVGDKAHVAYCLEGLAWVAAAWGEPEHAARLFGAAEASLEAASGVVYAHAQDRFLHEQAVDALRCRLGESSFARAWAEGRAMSVEEATDYALLEEEPGLVGASVPQVPPDGGQLAALTRREEEVALLVAQGLTDRQISAELVISERTVGNHVAKILKKLNLRSRTQVAAWVLKQQLLP